MFNYFFPHHRYVSHKDRILQFIGKFPGRDDDEIAAALKIQPRQTVNQACRSLARQGLTDRRANERGKLGNYPRERPTSVSFPRTECRIPELSPQPSIPADWYWEGNVVDRLADYLMGEGWKIVGRADTAKKERGVDLHAERSAEILLVEVKGYPSTQYRDPARAGQRKPTNPSLQAQHWFSHALLKAMRLQTEQPRAIVALGFPDFPRYRTLTEETSAGLSKLDLRIFFVDEAGRVDVFGV